MAKQRDITIKDVGPINRLTIPVPAGGGVTVLRARNGTGKTSAIEGITIALRQAGTLNRRRGAAGAAEVSVGGATARTAARTSHTGELEVCSIDDKLNLLDFIKPPVADPVAADTRRIKALLSVTGVEADFKLFDGLLPEGLMTKYTQASTRRQPDIVQMAKEVKKDLQEAARFAEADANEAKGSVAATRTALDGVNLKGESNDAVLRQNHLDAVSRKATLAAEAKAATEANKAREEAAARIETAAGEYKGPSVDEAKSAFAAATDAATVTHNSVETLKAKLAEAEKIHAAAREKERLAVEALNTATAHEKTVADLKAAAAGEPVKGPTEAQLAEAEKAITTAAEAITQGVRIREAESKKAKLAEYQKAEKEHSELATRIREAASNVDDVLSGAVKAPGLAIKEGRLWSTAHEDYFGDLSEGQRIKIALDIVLPIVGEGGLLPLPQDFWQDLDPVNKALVDTEAKKQHVCVLTAEVAEGDLRAELFEPAEAKA